MIIKEKINKNLIAISIVIAGIILAGAFIYINQGKSTVFTEEGDMQSVGDKAINYINENLLPPEITASLVEISDSGSVYKVRLSIENNEFDSYISKDGEFLFPDGYDMNQPLMEGLEETEVMEEPETPSLPQEELEKFIACLAQANFVIYGADWCGYTTSLISMLGGWETTKPIYIECTEETDLCTEKEITGYPTVLLDDNEFTGSRNLEDFAFYTGCLLP